MKPVLRSPVKVAPTSTIKSSTQKVLRIAEVINGRAAMQGALWGTLDWKMTGENLIQQCEDPVYAMAAAGVFATVAAASAITIDGIDDEKYWSFTPESELINGRLAMLAFVTLLGLSAM